MTLKDLDQIELKKIPTVVVYRKIKSSNKYYMLVTFKGIDIINNDRAKKPLINYKYEITELGVGRIFIQNWMNKYNINTFDFIE